MNNIRKAKIADTLLITEISIDVWKKTYEGFIDYASGGSTNRPKLQEMPK